MKEIWGGGIGSQGRGKGDGEGRFGVVALGLRRKKNGERKKRKEIINMILFTLVYPPYLVHDHT